MLRRKRVRAEKLHLQFVATRFFGKWHALYQYYYRIDHGATLMPPDEGDLHFLKKWWHELKAYTAKRREKAAVIAKAESGHRSIKGRKILAWWRKWAKDSSSLSRKSRRVGKVYSHDLKQRYFRAFQRAHYLSIAVSQLRFRHYSKRVFKAL